MAHMQGINGLRVKDRLVVEELKVAHYLPKKGAQISEKQVAIMHQIKIGASQTNTSLDSELSITLCSPTVVA